MNHLNYKHLRYFWAVAKTGSVTKAAEQLHLTPQSISGQLTEFANTLGVELFHKVGRNLELTDAGRRALSYADEIFSVGDELMAVLRDQRSKKSLPLRVGLADSVSKTIAYRLLEPAYEMQEPTRLICREARLVSLLSDLAVHRLDLIIADRPMPPNLHVKGFSHLIGESHMGLFGVAALVNKLKRTFPESLNNAPLLMIGEDAAVRGRINQWLAQKNLHPDIKGEFDDSALMKAFGRAGEGLFFAPNAIAKDICSQYKVVKLADIPSVNEQVYVITTERQLTHPLVKTICKFGRDDLFSTNREDG
ncbi:LysR family transcriptional regulator [Cellvibrio sp. BR]|uniref:transcriptional activator NhaR n=1 Tax=unclassified Cellvibrio TaxID=2624793 RepID=UPI0002600B4C|nr:MULTISPECIES: transcriptional activator NhaR [unclassified Cellvibrio]EIK42814.1 LysR family transcriptional regulator [Cellvibrio sp. BR]UUA74982.1 transcriptional activator NhaR [Cellvibrio sp. QJXJ]